MPIIPPFPDPHIVVGVPTMDDPLGMNPQDSMVICIVTPVDDPYNTCRNCGRAWSPQHNQVYVPGSARKA